jgi:hypothetical protein
MNTQHPIRSFDDAMHGRRILAVLPPSGKDRTKFIVSILEAAKARWGCHVDVVCDDLDQKPFWPLVAPSGTTHSPPPLLKVDEWEKTPEAVAEVERRMHEAERVAGVPTGRILLAGSHSVGRAYTAPVRYPPRYQIVRRVLKDNMEPFRIVRRLFRFADNMLEARQPDLVCAYEFGTPANFAIRLAAQRRNIPTVAIRYSKIISERMYWTTDPVMFNGIAIEQGNARRKADRPVSDAAKDHIRAFRERPKVVSYIGNKWRSRQKFFRWHLRYLRIVVPELLNLFRASDRSLREPALGRLFRQYRAFYLSLRQRRFMHTFDNDNLTAMKYIYFPLHKEGELVQCYQSTQWHNQINTVRVLASILPMGYRLLVREHRLNVGQRPTRYLRELSKIPNVTIIDAFDSQFKYLNNASVVVTESGSSGWEALLLKKRVLLLARTFYDGAGLGTKVTDPNRLNAALIDLLSRPSMEDDEAHDYKLACMIDADKDTSFPMTAKDIPVALEMLARVISPLRCSLKEASTNLSNA